MHFFPVIRVYRFQTHKALVETAISMVGILMHLENSIRNSKVISAAYFVNGIQLRAIFTTVIEKYLELRELKNNIALMISSNRFGRKKNQVSMSLSSGCDAAQIYENIFSKNGRETQSEKWLENETGKEDILDADNRIGENDLLPPNSYNDVKHKNKVPRVRRTEVANQAKEYGLPLYIAPPPYVETKEKFGTRIENSLKKSLERLKIGV